jgi:hypothetical protein
MGQAEETMKFPRSTPLAYAAAGLALTGIAVIAQGQAQPAQPAAQPAQASTAKPAPMPPLITKDNLRLLSQEDAIKAANNSLFGNPRQDGFYITRNRFGPNQTSRPHFHDKDRWVTVIKGTWHTGEGKVFRPKTMIPIKAGGMMYHPAGYIHYDGSQDGEEVVVHIMGHGPVTTTQVEEDEQGKPVSRGGGGAGYAVTPPAK